MGNCTWLFTRIIWVVLSYWGKSGSSCLFPVRFLIILLILCIMLWILLQHSLTLSTLSSHFRIILISVSTLASLYVFSIIFTADHQAKKTPGYHAGSTRPMILIVQYISWHPRLAAQMAIVPLRPISGIIVVQYSKAAFGWYKGKLSGYNESCLISMVTRLLLV